MSKIDLSSLEVNFLMDSQCKFSVPLKDVRLEDGDRIVLVKNSSGKIEQALICREQSDGFDYAQASVDHLNALGIPDFWDTPRMLTVDRVQLVSQ